MASHPAGIRTEADMYSSLLDKVESEGFDYAVREYSSEVCAIDDAMRPLVDAYSSSREAVQAYLEAKAQEIGRELAI